MATKTLAARLPHKGCAARPAGPRLHITIARPRAARVRVQHAGTLASASAPSVSGKRRNPGFSFDLHNAS
ncbi:hypothetical protein L210DRAFT_977850 [Boletus edulis BED1]|uniref:Uncharacterized protein n=1 Tax=Boletus edulis BED1 TaxID=1328754 RepID=A0AAD4GML8_BOLED|nr:hypothetical protein L210DRAFT_977850 [Boletus edulis BED1]